ncbi:MAG: class I SAM-dependent methyltransferase, partial [Armatimonadota bacterium]|nr:class I SAM-dependent methyltransferase [Armatimonadota bacterium]
IGADVVPALIARNQRLYGHEDRKFVVLDITRDPIPTVDVILCRDCLIHLSFRHIAATVTNFRQSHSRYLLATTHTTVPENQDIATGQWRSVNLQLPPFNFPPPLKIIIEDPELGKCLGLWRLAEL